MDDLDVVNILAGAGLVFVYIITFSLIGTIWTNVEVAELGIAYTTKIDTVICAALTFFAIKPLFKVFIKWIKCDV